MIPSSDGEHIRNDKNDYRRGDAVFRQAGRREELPQTRTIAHNTQSKGLEVNQ